jgi:LacI family repressor for deo operon, udp, cdd, tsx, nupC, and nupG
MGLRVPQDLSVLGFDSTSLCTWSSPPICSLYNPAREIGRVGVQALIEAIQSKQSCTLQARLPVTLHPRGSCGPPPSAQ